MLKRSKGYIQVRYHTFVICVTVSSLIAYFIANYIQPRPQVIECPATPIQPLVESQVLETQPMCLYENARKCVPPFAKFISKISSAQKYYLAACAIEKSMSTMITAIMCLLHDQTEFLARNRSLSSELWENRFCKHKNEYQFMKDMLVRTHTNINDWKIFTIVRDPLERFLSGFVDKCILEKRDNAKCYGCKKNITCFLEKTYNRALFQYHANLTQWTYEDVHFFPQNWRCDFHNHINKIEVVHYYARTSEKYKKMLDGITEILRTSNVPKTTIKYINDELLKKRKMPHATSESPERELYAKRLKNDKIAMDLLIRLYYYDFILFGNLYLNNHDVDLLLLKMSNESKTRLYVGHLPFDCRYEDIQAMFIEHGTIIDISPKKGFAFVEFENEAEAEAVIKEFDNKMYRGDRIVVTYAINGGYHSYHLRKNVNRQRGSRSRSRSPIDYRSRRRSYSPDRYRRDGRRFDRDYSPPPHRYRYRGDYYDNRRSYFHRSHRSPVRNYSSRSSRRSFSPIHRKDYYEDKYQQRVKRRTSSRCNYASPKRSSLPPHRSRGSPKYSESPRSRSISKRSNPSEDGEVA